MKQALSHLLNDLLSAILFLAVYLTTANITAAAAVAITVGLAQITVQRLTGRRIWPMQWIGLAVVVVLSAASIATQSPRFVMLKPSLGHFAIAAAIAKWPRLGFSITKRGLCVAIEAALRTTTTARPITASARSAFR